MAIRRSVQQKENSEVAQHIQLTYSLPKSHRVTSSRASATKAQTPDTQLFGYSATLIYRDIAKTFVVTAITVGILAVLLLTGRLS